MGNKLVGRGQGATLPANRQAPIKVVNYVRKENPPTCLIKLQNTSTRALLDTGADVSILSNQFFKKLQGKGFQLKSAGVKLRAASGAFLQVLGSIRLRFEVQGKCFRQTFIIVENLNRDCILGRDFLANYNCIIDLGDRTCTIGDLKIPICDLNQVRSIVRLTQDVEIAPYHLQTTFGKYHRKAGLVHGQNISWHQTDQGFLENEPGLNVMNGVGTASSSRKVPITLVNQTGKWFQLKKGNVVAVIEKDEEVLNDMQVLAEDLHENCNVSEIPIQNSDSLNDQQKAKLRKLLDQNCDVFAKDEYDLGKTDLIKCSIKTGNATPIRKKPYRTPFAYREEVGRQIDEMLKLGLISPSNSSWAAPILCVKKKDGGIRICCDYRALNDVTEKFYWPLPNVDDIFSNLGGARFFSSLDFLKGYHQIPMESKSKNKTAFVCEEGLFEYNYMPFGLSCAPSVYQECMSRMLNGLGSFATAYLDDVLIWSKTFELHLQHLQIVFDRIRNAKLKLKASKCEFLKKEMKYLGHVIKTNGELQVDKDKVKVIEKLQAPKTVREVRSFVGMLSYYRRYIPEFSKVAAPLTSLTKKNCKFQWTDEQERSFATLKEALLKAPILHLPTIGEPFQLFTDASDAAIGALLTQKVGDTFKPVYYLSHLLSDTQRRWPIIEKEAYSIVFALEKFRPFLMDTPCKVFSDHCPLKYIHSADNKNAKLQRWATKISGFGAKIEFLPGHKNKQADFLSRLEVRNIPKYVDTPVIESRVDDVMLLDIVKNENTPQENELKETCVPELSPNIDFRECQEKDKKIKEIIDHLKSHRLKSKFYGKYVIVDNLLYNVDRDENLRLEVPKALQETLIKEMHEGTLGRHIGRDRTFDNLRIRYHWKGMATMTYDYVAQCGPCNEQNLRTKAAPIQDVPIADYPFQRLAIDLAGPYPETLQGNKLCLTVTDHFSGWIEAFAIPDKKAVTIAKILLDEVFRRFSWCRFITSDNGTEMVNEVLTELTNLGNIHHIRTSIYHPQANGKAERPHHTMVACLAKVAKINNWDEYLPSFCSAYNFSRSAGRKFSPYYLVYHRDPTLPVDTILQRRDRYYGEEYLPQALERMHTAYRLVRKRLKEQAEYNKEYANKHRGAKMSSFEVGDPIYLRNYVRANKLDKKWMPYFRVIGRRGPVSYLVQNQLTGKTQRVHVGDMQKARGSDAWKVETKPINDKGARNVIPESDTDEESVDSEEELIEKNYESESEEETPVVNTGRPSRKAKEAAKKKIKKYSDSAELDIEAIVGKKLKDIFGLVAGKLE